MEVGTTPHESVQMLSAKTVLGFAGIMGWTLFFLLLAALLQLLSHGLELQFVRES